MNIRVSDERWKKLSKPRRDMIRRNREKTSELLKRFDIEDKKRVELRKYINLGYFK